MKKAGHRHTLIFILWAAAVYLFYFLQLRTIEFYEYSQKAALSKHFLRDFYFYGSFATTVIFGVLLLWFFMCAERRVYSERLKNHRITVLEKFSSHIAHEIRNPLTSLSLNAELVGQSADQLEGPRAEELQKLTGDIINDVARLTEATEHYLDFRNKSNRNETFEIRPLLEHLIEEMHSEAEPKSIHVLLKLHPQTSVILRGNSDRFLLAMKCLIKNAVEAMPQGGFLVFEGVRRFRKFILRIKDTGVGITHDNMERLFEPFFTTKLKGVGLGLCLVKQVSEEFGAAVRVKSTLGKGTAFQITFPLVK